MRLATLGNGCLAMTFDNHLILRELFYPVVGLTNHAAETGGNTIVLRHLGKNLQLGSNEWMVSSGYGSGMSFVSRLKHKDYSLRVLLKEEIDSERPIWDRYLDIAFETSTIDVFFKHQFRLLGNDIGETAVWDPLKKRLYHYKGSLWLGIHVTTQESTNQPLSFVAKVRDGGVGPDDNGIPRGSTIDHGLIESLLTLHCGDVTKRLRVHYRLALGNSKEEVDLLLDTPKLYEPTEIVESEDNDLAYLKDTSIKVLLAHCDKDGGILAALDDEIMTDYRDHYRYVWPRDAAMCASTLLKMGYALLAKRYLNFAARVPKLNNFFWHRYRSD
jgi:GH15 family glucan-1,4-alpha-glucosidase